MVTGVREQWYSEGRDWLDCRPGLALPPLSVCGNLFQVAPGTQLEIIHLPSTSVTNIAPNITPTLLYDEYPQYSVLTLLLDDPPPPVGWTPGTDQAPGHGHHQTGRQHAQHAAQQQGQPLHLLLDHLVLVGAAVLVVAAATAEDVDVVVTDGTVEAGVPGSRGVNVAGAVLGAQDCWRTKYRI